MKISISDLLRLVIVLVTGCLFLINPASVTYSQICIITILDIILCGIMIYFNKSFSIQNPILIFLIMTVIFSLGQNLAYLFIQNPEVVSDSLLYPYKYSEIDMNTGSIYTIQALNMFVVGLFGKKTIHKFGKIRYKKISNQEELAIAFSGYYIGTGIFLLTLIPQILYFYVSIMQYFTIGYGDTATSQLPGIILRLHYLFIPVVFIRFISKIKLNKNILIDECIIIILVIVFLVIGDRGSGLAVLVTYIWIKAVLDNKFDIKKYILPCVFVVLLIPIIKYYRIYFTQNQASAFVGAISYVLNNNPIIDLLLETGSTQRIIIMTMHKVRIEGLAHGAAYLDFFIKMLPGKFGVSQNYGTLAKWLLNSTAYQSYGFSIWAEAYLNFGYVGIPFMYLIGLLLKKLFYYDKTLNIFQLMKTSISLYFFADIARRSFSEFGYNFLYDMIIPLIVIYIGARWLRKVKESSVKR